MFKNLEDGIFEAQLNPKKTNVFVLSETMAVFAK